MKKLFFLTLLSGLFLGSPAARAQTDTTIIPTNIVPIEEPPGEVFTLVEHMPEFPGGEAALTAYIQKNTKYPADAREKSIQGRVVVMFVVDATGQIKNVKVARPIYPSLDNEAMRVVKTMPKWNPGTQGGKPVATYYNLPITFQLR